jgi:hypothetical protein
MESDGTTATSEERNIEKVEAKEEPSNISFHKEDEISSLSNKNEEKSKNDKVSLHGQLSMENGDYIASSDSMSPEIPRMSTRDIQAMYSNHCHDILDNGGVIIRNVKQSNEENTKEVAVHHIIIIKS